MNILRVNSKKLHLVGQKFIWLQKCNIWSFEIKFRLKSYEKGQIFRGELSKCDVYSLGITLICTKYLKNPKNFVELENLIKRLKLDCNNALSRIIVKMIHPDPKIRIEIEQVLIMLNLLKVTE